ncbi:hypothetical protein KM043_002756 [Ampulex compressa]|nr:hypothetical protein KM043_002756 [Ampulex compressa]
MRSRRISSDSIDPRSTLDLSFSARIYLDSSPKCERLFGGCNIGLWRVNIKDRLRKCGSSQESLGSSFVVGSAGHGRRGLEPFFIRSRHASSESRRREARERNLGGRRTGQFLEIIKHGLYERQGWGLKIVGKASGRERRRREVYAGALAFCLL